LDAILLIGNKPETLDFVVSFLKIGGYDPITCSDEGKALKVIEERYNDIGEILLDRMMQRLDPEKFALFKEIFPKWIITILFSNSIFFFKYL